MTRQAARQVPKQFAATSIGPLHIIKYHEQRSTRANSRQQLVHSLAQTHLFLLRREGIVMVGAG